MFQLGAGLPIDSFNGKPLAPSPTFDPTKNSLPTSGLAKTLVKLKLNNWPHSVKVAGVGNCLAVFDTLYNYTTALPANNFPLGLRIKRNNPFAYINFFPVTNPEQPVFYDPDAIEITPEGYNLGNFPAPDQAGYKPSRLIRQIRGVDFQTLYIEGYGGFAAPANGVYQGDNPTNYNPFWVDVLTWFDPTIVPGKIEIF